ncbi:MAG: ATP-binding protein [Clostridiales Family XIII bacterium]|nr:ATP-binding protein [Clostridiales Family XIII bacterium]
MRRLIEKELLAWKEKGKRKPLIVQGVRQCGKTYSIKQFGSEHYADVYYCKFDEDDTLADFFSPDLNPRRIIRDMSLFRGKDIMPGETLMIFDEIQSCGKALASLKYFCEEAPEYDIIAAGSLLGVAVPQGTSFPVGKVEFLTLRPMGFYEFLLAHNEPLAETLNGSDFGSDVWGTFRSRLEEYLRNYFIVGGMPEAVQAWIETGSIDEVERIQKQIIASYENDFSKHAPLSDFPKISAVWSSIPGQLARENKKFFFSRVRKSWRARDLEDALEWLVRAGMVHRVERIEKPGIPVSAYAVPTSFKLYFADIGILRSLANLPAAAFFEKDSAFREFKGAIAENYALNELKLAYDEPIYYWAREGSSRAEVDFVFQDGMDIVPLEVKAGSAAHAQSLNSYCRQYAPKKSVLTSSDDKKNILPLHAFWRIKDWLAGCANG